MGLRIVQHQKELSLPSSVCGEMGSQGPYTPKKQEETEKMLEIKEGGLLSPCPGESSFLFFSDVTSRFAWKTRLEIFFSYSSHQRGLCPLWIGTTHFLTAIAWLLMVKDESGKTDFAGHIKEFDSAMRTMASLWRFIYLFIFSSTVSWNQCSLRTGGVESLCFLTTSYILPVSTLEKWC